MNPIKKKNQNSALAPRAMGAQSDGGTLTETWKKANDSTYNGHLFHERNRYNSC
jgi:hypothetical protein